MTLASEVDEVIVDRPETPLPEIDEGPSMEDSNELQIFASTESPPSHSPHPRPRPYPRPDGTQPLDTSGRSANPDAPSDDESSDNKPILPIPTSSPRDASPKRPTPRPRPTNPGPSYDDTPNPTDNPVTYTKASPAERERLMCLYISRFVFHFRKFRDPKKNMRTLNELASKSAFDGSYTDLTRFHNDYFTWYVENVRHSAYMERQVRDEMAKWTWAAWHWWGRCLGGEVQGLARRKEMVCMVVEELKKGKFDNKVFQERVDKFCRRGSSSQLEGSE